MYRFSRWSKSQLEGCTARLRLVAQKAIELVNFRVMEGPRSEEEQRENVEYGVSQTMDSRHLDRPARAFDFVPWYADEPHVRWPDRLVRVARRSGTVSDAVKVMQQYAAERSQWAYMAGIMVGVGHARGIPLRWGGDWDQDGFVLDNRFNDLGHIEEPA